MYLCVFDLQVSVCDAVCAVQSQALLLPGVPDLVRRLHSLTHLQQYIIRNRLRSVPVPLETTVQRTLEKHLTETHTVCPPEQTPSEHQPLELCVHDTALRDTQTAHTLPGQLLDLVSHALVVEVIVQENHERLRVCVCVRDALLLPHLLKPHPHAINLRESVRLIQECVSLSLI